MKAKIFLLCLVGLAIFLAFCLQPETKPIKELKVSHQLSWHHVALFVIVEKGWDEKVLGVKIKTTSFPSGPPQMEAFAANEHEIAYVGATPPLSILAKGFDAKIVAVANMEGSSLVAIPDVSYEGPQSLEGKRIMTFPPGSIQHTVLMEWLKKNDVDISKVEIKSGGPAEIREALRAKAVEFAFAPDPTPYIAEIEGYGKIFVGSKDMIPSHPCCVVLMRGDFMKTDLAAKFLALHIVASEYAKDPRNKEEVKQILKKWLGLSDEVANAFPGTTNLQTEMTEEWLKGMELLYEIQYSLNITKDEKGNPIKLSHEKVIDFDLYKKALELVPEVKKKVGYA